MNLNRTTFLAIFLIILGVLGLIVGIAKHHLTESVASFVMYVLPIVLGIVILAVERTGGRE